VCQLVAPVPVIMAIAAMVTGIVPGDAWPMANASAAPTRGSRRL